MKTTIRIILFLVFAFFAMEAAARIDDYYRFGANMLWPYNYEIMFDSDEFGRKGRPYARYEKWKLNNLGFRGPDVLLDKKDKIRIVTMGASETFGLYEKEGKEWPRQLETLLKEELKDRGVEVINVALAGLILSSQIPYFEHRVLKLHPDLIVLYGNFIDKFYYEKNLNGSLIGTKNSEVQSIQKITNSIEKEKIDLRPRIFRKIKSKIRGLFPAKYVRKYDQFDLARKIKIKRKNNKIKVLTVIPPSIFKQTEGDLVRFIETIKENKIKLILVSHAANLDDLGILGTQEVKLFLSGEAVIMEHQGLNELIARLALSSNISYVDLAREIKADDRNMADSTHFTDRGAFLVAEKLMPEVERQISK